MRASPRLSWDRTGLKGKVPEAKSGLRRLPRHRVCVFADPVFVFPEGANIEGEL